MAGIIKSLASDDTMMIEYPMALGERLGEGQFWSEAP